MSRALAEPIAATGHLSNKVRIATNAHVIFTQNVARTGLQLLQRTLTVASPRKFDEARMGFLSEHDQIQLPDPVQQAKAKSGHLIQWYRTSPRALFDELRAARPILSTAFMTMATRATDVLDILGKHETYTVHYYSKSMDPSVGPFMLARDETTLNWHEKAVMRTVLRHDDLPRIRAMVADLVAAELAAAPGTLDIGPAIGRRVPVRIVQDYFGFKAPDDKLLAWSLATQNAMFRNLTENPDIQNAANQAGAEMRHWLWGFLTERLGYPHLTGDDAIGRLVRLSGNPDMNMPIDRLVSNVCGLLVGAVETINQAIVQVVAELLARPDILAEAIAAAHEDDPTRFDGYVWEALRFNPITWVQIRYVARDVVLGAGTPYATPLKAGQRLAAATGSAMFDPDLMPDPDRFDPTRPRSSYLHTGHGHHECLGKYVSQVAIPEAVRQILRVPGVRPADGAAGRIDMGKFGFPEHFHVTWPNGMAA